MAISKWRAVAHLPLAIRLKGFHMSFTILKGKTL
jgi:hypothetical protein